MDLGDRCEPVARAAHVMELEHHQIDMRYERLRRTSAARERQLCASLAEMGQQTPVVVVCSDEGRHVLVDGYKRVRALKKLRQDTVRAVSWELSEMEALLLERLMRTGDADSPLEQGWLLSELHERFGLPCDELARRFDRSKSWVSRRVSLVSELPSEIQCRVRTGELAAHAVMKYLVPLARANMPAAKQLAAALAPLRLTTRQVGLLYAAWQAGTEKTRELVVTSPQTYLRAQEAQRQDSKPAKSEAQMLADDLGAVGGIARRVRRRLVQGVMQRLQPGEPEEIARLASEARTATESLFTRFAQEAGDAG